MVIAVASAHIAPRTLTYRRRCRRPPLP